MQARFHKPAIAMLTALLFESSPLRADDIDLYVGGPQTSGAVANVLIVLDNSSNWAASNQNWPDGGKQGVSELETLSEVVGTLSDNVNVGLMTFAQSGSNFGGQVRYHIRAMDSTNRARFQQIADHMATHAVGANDPDEVASSTDYDSLMNSVFRYFNGLARWKDVNAGEDRRDYRDNAATGVFDPNPNPAAYLWGYDTNSQANYNKPADAGAGCAKNYVIFIGNGFPSNVGSSSEITDALALLTADQKSGTTGWAVTPDLTSVTTISPKNPWADEWARFMYSYGVPSAVTNQKFTAGIANQPKYIWNKIATYTLDVCKDHCEDPQATLLKSMAKVGGGKYFKSTSKAEIKSALALIFAEIQAVNSVFASATLPISVNTQGTYENQVYIGVFRPDANSRPRWYGNLKEYKFGRYCDFDGKVWDAATSTLTTTAQYGKVLIDSTRSLPLTGSFSGTDERVADDVAAPDCGYYTDTSGNHIEKIPVKLYMADKNGYRAIDEAGNTGFIDLSAQSYWTTASTFWDFYKVDPSGSSDSPDGPNVERGGAAQRLRTKWQGTAPSGHPDGRKVYSCFSCAAGDALANHKLTTSNGDVTTALAIPSGSATMTLSRWGDYILAQTASGGAHGFDGATTITFSGASPASYNVSCSPSEITSVWSSGFWCRKAGLEQPPTISTWPYETANISPVTFPVSITQLTVVADATSSTGYLATASGVNSLAAATSVVISGTGTQSWLTGTHTVKAASASQFTYEVTPTMAAATVLGTSRAGTASALNNTTISYNAASKKVVVLVSTTGNLGNEYNAGNSVTVAGATPSTYNGIWVSAGKGTDCPGITNSTSDKGKYYCFSIIRSPDPGTSIIASPIDSPVLSYIYRAGADSSLYAWPTNFPDRFPTTLAAGNQVVVSGASVSAYNGTFTVSQTWEWNGTGFFDEIRFGTVALSPAQPTGTAVASTSGTNSGPTTANLINWLRGKDLWEDENQNASLTDVRASIHGDVLHARPVVVNYGSTQGIVGFYGSNDGFLRAIKGGLADSDGEEKWAFMPAEFMSYNKMSRLYSNSNVIRYPNQSCAVSPTPTPRSYQWDGPIAAYQTPDGTASTAPSKTYIYATMRRGGRMIYALNVTDPDNPKFLWKIGCTTPTGGCDTGFSEMGQTWSEPKITKLRYTHSVTGQLQEKLVLIFGAGYDAAVEDKAPGSARAPTMGTGVYVLDAETGAKLAFLQSPHSTRYSIAADVNALDLNGDGYVDRIYAADTGGNILRFDPDPTQDIAPASGYWKKYLIARLGDVGDDGGSDARKFLFQPEVLPFSFGGSTQVNILVGSGDREKPLPNLASAATTNTLSCGANYDDSYYASSVANIVTDRFYSVIDSVQAGASESTVNASPIVESNLQEVNANPNALTPFVMGGEKSGWYITLKNNPKSYALTTAEEKVVNAPRLVGGVVFFATSTPAAPDASVGICTNLGEALGYAINPFTGLPAINRDGSESGGQPTLTAVDYATKFAGGGLPPTVTAGVVTVGRTPYRFVIGSGGETLTSESSIAGARTILDIRGTRTKLFWSYGAD